jgi:chemotaxis-related protein WspB
MLFILFQLGQDWYAIEAGRVVEVVPLVALKHLPQAPRGVAGIFNYRGRPVPALDLSELTLGQPAQERLSTRIIIVRCQASGGVDQLLGLVAEHATGTLRREPGDFVAPAAALGAAPYLGPILMDQQRPIQWIQEQRLLSAAVRDLLFSELNAIVS